MSRTGFRFECFISLSFPVQIQRLKFFLHQQQIDIKYNSSGALINSEEARKWAEAVLSYSNDGMRQVLLDVDHMILGKSHVFQVKSSVLLLREKLRGKSGAMCQELKRYLAYLLCLQTSGHAAKAIALLVLGHEPAKAEQTLKLLEKRLEEQSVFLEYHGVLPFYIDGAMTWHDGRTYFFKGTNYWRYNDAEGKCDSGYPKPIKEGWGGMQGPIDAVFLGNIKKSYATYFFKGSSYYQYRKEHGQVSHPQPIENWGGLDGPVDGVFTWRNGATYAFAGDAYYRLESGTFTGPFPISKWGGLTGPVNTVFRYKKDDSTYFFKEWKYYKFEDKGDRRLSVSGPWELDHKWRGIC